MLNNGKSERCYMKNFLVCFGAVAAFVSLFTRVILSALPETRIFTDPTMAFSLETDKFIVIIYWVSSYLFLLIILIFASVELYKIYYKPTDRN